MSQRFRHDPAKRHGHDPGVHAGFARARHGIVDVRRGVKRIRDLVKGPHGNRELEQARLKIDEAEFWLNAAIQAVKSEPYPPKHSLPFEWLYADGAPEDGIQEAACLRADLATHPEAAAVILKRLVAQAGEEITFDHTLAAKEWRRAELKVWDEEADEPICVYHGAEAEKEGILYNRLDQLRYITCAEGTPDAVEWWRIPRKAA